MHFKNAYGFGFSYDTVNLKNFPIWRVLYEAALFEPLCVTLERGAPDIYYFSKSHL